MIYIRSFLFNLAFYIWTAFCTLLTIFVLPLSQKYAYFPRILWSLGTQKIIFIAGMKVEYRGRENIPEGPCLIASKHQSAWDTTAFFWFLPDVAVVLKKELTRIPFFGWYMFKVRAIPIDRSAGGSAIKKMLKTAKKILKEKHSILIFPEGTRVPAGKKLPYQPGVYALYHFCDLPTVPVALNSGLFWPRRKFLRRPGKIVMEFLPPIPKGLDKKTYMARLEKDIEGGTNRLIREAKRKDKSL